MDDERKKKLGNTLLAVKGVLLSVLDETIIKSHEMKERLNAVLNNENIPTELPGACLEQYKSLFQDVSSRLEKDELFFMKLVEHIKAIVNDANSDSISNCTRILLLSLHSECYKHKTLQEKKVGMLTGAAIKMLV